jgi:hypothetical protein
VKLDREPCRVHDAPCAVGVGSNGAQPDADHADNLDGDAPVYQIVNGKHGCSRMPSVNNCDWITEPPIEEVTGREAASYARTMKGNITEWGTGYTEPKERVSGVPTKLILDHSCDMCDVVWRMDAAGPRRFIYLITGSPVGIVVYTDLEKQAYVDQPVTHPAAEFAGSIMLEFVFNKRLSEGKTDQLSLSPQWAENVAAYAALGFSGDRTRMRLDPSNSGGKWKLSSGKWRYVSSRPMGPLYAGTQRTA